VPSGHADFSLSDPCNSGLKFPKYNMIDRRIATELNERLNEAPAVVLLGPRQVGKTTLALAIAEKRSAVYLDLESDADRAKVAEPELYPRSNGV